MFPISASQKGSIILKTNKALQFFKPRNPTIQFKRTQWPNFKICNYPDDHDYFLFTKFKFLVLLKSLPQI